MKVITPILFFMYSCSASTIQEKVIICGVCRDVETRLPYSINIIEAIGDLFQDYRVIVYENNSHDKTVQILQQWQQKNPRINVNSETLTQDELNNAIINRTKEGSLFRPELIARARNIVLKKATSDIYSDYHYIIWIDMDFKIMPNLHGIREVFTSNKEWDAVFAYGVDPSNQYWDWYALRDNIDPLGPELLGHDWFVPKKLTLRETDDWYPVYSAFGGCGIYKKSSITGCTYSALVSPDLEFVAQKIIAQEKEKHHTKIVKYLSESSLLNLHKIFEQPTSKLPDIKDMHTGIILNKDKNPLIWRMNSFTYKYPATCEHVTFHASMIKNGHNKLFINPRMVFTYGG